MLIDKVFNFLVNLRGLTRSKDNMGKRIRLDKALRKRLALIRPYLLCQPYMMHAGEDTAKSM
jgi:hypothetical protein